MSEELSGDVQSEEFEEIDAQEVERVTATLADLMESVESQDIYELLQQAYDGIAEFAEWEDESAGEEPFAAAA